MPPKKTPKFEEGERVLCFHGPLMYEAKCLKVTVKNGVSKAFVHYSGWNKSWDEWVDEGRVHKWTEETIAKQKALAATTASATKPRRGELPSRSAISADSGMATSPRRTSGSVKDDATKAWGREMRPRKKARPDTGVETEADFQTRIEVKLPLLDELRRLLVEDWDMVVNQRKLVTLPRSPCVEDILRDYREAKAKNPAFSEEMVGEVVDGLRAYFDQALGTMLLFGFERLQYNRILDDHKAAPMSTIYGAEHLLRLFVKLPMLLVHTAMDEESLEVLVTHLQEFMKYMAKNAGTLFQSEYEATSQEYIKVASQQKAAH